MHGATALVANAVQLFDGANRGGFVLGTDVKANSLKVNYHFAAFKAVAGKVAVGTYEGSNSSQSITGLGFAPALVIMMSEHSEEMVFRTSASSATCNFHDNGCHNDWVTSMDADGFTIGTDKRVNENNRTFHYAAWKAITNRGRGHFEWRVRTGWSGWSVLGRR
jgi:hypothetical protein